MGTVRTFSGRHVVGSSVLSLDSPGRSVFPLLALKGPEVAWCWAGVSTLQSGLVLLPASCPELGHLICLLGCFCTCECVMGSPHLPFLEGEPGKGSVFRRAVCVFERGL